MQILEVQPRNIFLMGVLSQNTDCPSKGWQTLPLSSDSSSSSDSPSFWIVQHPTPFLTAPTLFQGVPWVVFLWERVVSAPKLDLFVQPEVSQGTSKWDLGLWILRTENISNRRGPSQGLLCLIPTPAPILTTLDSPAVPRPPHLSKWYLIWPKPRCCS